MKLSSLIRSFRSLVEIILLFTTAAIRIFETSSCLKPFFANPVWLAIATKIKNMKNLVALVKADILVITDIYLTSKQK